MEHVDFGMLRLPEGKHEHAQGAGDLPRGGARPGRGRGAQGSSARRTRTSPDARRDRRAGRDRRRDLPRPQARTHQGRGLRPGRRCCPSRARPAPTSSTPTRGWRSILRKAAELPASRAAGEPGLGPLEEAAARILLRLGRFPDVLALRRRPRGAVRARPSTCSASAGRSTAWYVTTGSWARSRALTQAAWPWSAASKTVIANGLRTAGCRRAGGNVGSRGSRIGRPRILS